MANAKHNSTVTQTIAFSGPHAETFRQIKEHVKANPGTKLSPIIAALVSDAWQRRKLSQCG